jgi:hypothetical protein
MGAHDDDYGDDPDADEVSIPRTYSDDIPTSRTGSHRKITQTDAEEIARASAKRAAAAQRDDDLREMQLLLAEWFGAKGDGGRVKAMQLDIADNTGRIVKAEGRIRKLWEFKARVLWVAGGVLTLAGIAGGVLADLVKGWIHSGH